MGYPRCHQAGRIPVSLIPEINLPARFPTKQVVSAINVSQRYQAPVATVMTAVQTIVGWWGCHHASHTPNLYELLTTSVSWARLERAASEQFTVAPCMAGNAQWKKCCRWVLFQPYFSEQMLLLLGCYRRLRMTLRSYTWKVNDCWRMGEVSHSYGGFVGGRDGGCGWKTCGTELGGFGRMSGDAGALI